MALQSLFGASSGSASGGTYPWMQQQLQPDQKKTINTVNAGVTAPTTNTSPLQPQYTVGQNIKVLTLQSWTGILSSSNYCSLW